MSLEVGSAPPIRARCRLLAETRRQASAVVLVFAALTGPLPDGFPSYLSVVEASCGLLTTQDRAARVGAPLREYLCIANGVRPSNPLSAVPFASERH